MTWSDRSASHALQWWDRVVRRHAPRELKIPEDDRSLFSAPFRLCLVSIGLKLCGHAGSADAVNNASFHTDHAISLLLFAATLAAWVSPPLRLVLFNERRIPRVGIG